MANEICRTETTPQQTVTPVPLQAIMQSVFNIDASYLEQAKLAGNSLPASFVE
jgi:hypothetical protein